MTTVKTVSKTVLVREWNQIEPKLLAVFAGLASATALTALAGLFHYKLDPTLAVALAGLLALIVGYLKSSTLKAFPAAQALTDTVAVVEAAVPAIAPQVAVVENLVAPAFDSLITPVSPAPILLPPTV
jgi:hypothetical protein